MRSRRRRTRRRRIRRQPNPFACVVACAALPYRPACRMPPRVTVYNRMYNRDVVNVSCVTNVNVCACLSISVLLFPLSAGMKILIMFRPPRSSLNRETGGPAPRPRARPFLVRFCPSLVEDRPMPPHTKCKLARLPASHPSCPVRIQERNTRLRAPSPHPTARGHATARPRTLAWRCALRVLVRRAA